MILILGAGLAGLATAMHLGSRPYRVLEREAVVGGLARSVDQAGFVFDFTGHLLHLASPEVTALVDQLLGPDQVKLDRSAWIGYGGKLVPYPFQVNTHELPVDVRLDCLVGFAESLRQSKRLAPGTLEAPRDPLPLSFLNVKEPTGGYAASFREWAIATFGEGFAKHFFLDYNAKNFAADLSTVTAEWVSWAVPKPSLDDVLRGALVGSQKTFGYNPRFRYPRSGGIRALPEAMAKRLVPGSIERDCVVTAIDSRAKRATLADGRTIEYSSLVASNPLPELVAMTSDLPNEVHAAAKRLRWCAVSSFNFGIEGDLGHDRHWIYYPEREFSFYRVGFPSNLAPSMAPKGSASLCAEVAYSGDAFPPRADEIARVRADLVRCGALPHHARIVTEQRLDLPYAYVLFDEARRRALPVIFRALLERDIVPVGRYGAWDYLSMETTIQQGIETARYLAARA